MLKAAVLRNCALSAQFFAKEGRFYERLPGSRHFKGRAGQRHSRLYPRDDGACPSDPSHLAGCHRGARSCAVRLLHDGQRPQGRRRERHDADQGQRSARHDPHGFRRAGQCPRLRAESRSRSRSARRRKARRRHGGRSRGNNDGHQGSQHERAVRRHGGSSRR